MIDPFKCEFCEKIFSTKYSLALHIKTASYCLKLRGEDAPGLMCEHCGQPFTRINNLRAHLKTCRSKTKKQEEEIVDELERLRNQEKIWKQTNLKNKTLISSLQLKTEKLEKVVIEQNKQINLLKESDGLDQIISNKNDELANMRKINYAKNRKIASLEKQLAFEKGRVLEASKPKTINQNYKCSTKNKLASIPTGNIEPFTVETIRANLHNYTYEDFLMGPKGLIKFLKSIIMNTNENGEIERNYVCTDLSRNNYFRLEETKEWDSDRGALYIETFVDEMHRPTSNYFDQLCSKVVDRTDALREYNAHLMEELKPFYQGVLRPISKERDALLTTIKTGIKSSASL